MLEDGFLDNEVLGSITGTGRRNQECANKSHIDELARKETEDERACRW